MVSHQGPRMTVQVLGSQKIGNLPAAKSTWTIMPFGRSRPAADAAREVVERWLLNGLDVSVGHRRCPCDPSSQNDAGRTPASQLRTKYHTSLRSHSRRFCSTLPLFP